MSKQFSSLVRSLVAAAGVAVAFGAACTLPAASALAQAGAPAKAEKTVRLTLKGGRVVEGILVSENSVQVVLRVKTAVGMAQTTYERAEIEKMETVEGAAGAPAPAPKNEPAAAGSSGADKTVRNDGEKDEKKDAKAKRDQFGLIEGVNPEDPAAARIFMVPIKGEFGVDFSYTGLREVLKDAKKIQPDYIVVYFDARFVNSQGQDANILNPRDALSSIWMLDTARSISLALTDGIRDDSEWTKKPKLIAWVKRAVGPTAYMPFVCPQVFYTSDGLHGGIGYLDFAFANMQDEVVREKLRGAMAGRAEGLAIKGGHDPRVLRAMLRVDYVLSYNMVGGKPEFYEDDRGESLLTDDGNPEAGRADSIDDRIRFKGNDVLILTAPVAQRIQFSSGTVDTLEDLAFELGISRSYRVYNDLPSRQLRETAQAISKADRQFERLEQDLREAMGDRANGETPDIRNGKRGKVIRICDEMISILNKYPEVSARRGGVDDIVTELTRVKNNMQQEIRLDRPVRQPR